MRKVLAASIAAAAAFVATPGLAAPTIVPQDNSSPGPTLSFTGGTAVAQFNSQQYTVTGPFTDTYYFTLAQIGKLIDGTLSTSASGSKAPYNADLDISVVNLTSGATTIFSFIKSTSPNGTDKNETFSIPAANLNTLFQPGTYSLTISGVADNVGTAANNQGNYTGSLTFASVAVPEPATWAMMLMGFGLIGAGLRSRSKVRTNVRFA